VAIETALYILRLYNKFLDLSLRGVDSITSSIISRNMNFYWKTLGPLYDRTLCVIGVCERAYHVR